MDELALQWQERFEKIWDPEGGGRYRLGSPGQRLVPLFLNYVGDGQTVNDYGSGTGRAVVAMRAQRRFPIHMVDIAENALEDEAKEILGEDLDFTHAPLWALPSDFPRADWGYCIDVLMTVPPEKLDEILGELFRTCENLFCQVYDWPDVRLDVDLTTIQGNAAWWKAKLMERWPFVAQIESQEHRRRYIFACTRQGQEAAKSKGTIMALKGAYAGQTAWIVGRGPSLLNVTKEAFGAGPVICLNEAIINISGLRLPNDVYTLWRNGDVLPDLPKHGAAMLLCENPVRPDPPSATLYPDYDRRYIFECRRDLGCDPPATFTMLAALEIAVRIMGCTKIVFVSFDSCTVGDVRTVLEGGFVQSEHRPGAYNEQGEIVKARVAELGLDVEWVTPAKPTGPIRLNLGCGEILMEDCINIDLHCGAADVRMDVRKLEYEDGAADEIHASHLLEHFGKNEVLPLLKEWRRVLKSGGILNLVVPDLTWCLKNWLESHEKEGYPLAMIYGLQSNDGEYHKTGFTAETLKRFLVDAGFGRIRISHGRDDRHAQEVLYANAVAEALQEDGSYEASAEIPRIRRRRQR